MGRKRQVNYWPTRGTWTDENGEARKGGYWTTFEGRQVPLAMGPDDAPQGPNYLKALKTYANLWAPTPSDQAGMEKTPRVIFDAYLCFIEGKARGRTFSIRKKYLAAFCKERMADEPLSALTLEAAEAWLARMRTPRKVETSSGYQKGLIRTFAWGDGNVGFAVQSLKAALNWARKRKTIPTNPLDGLQQPPPQCRSRLCVLSDLDQVRVLGAARGQLRELVTCLDSTGCRPGELLHATANAWNDRQGALVYYPDSLRRSGERGHKTGRKEIVRRIFFRGEALAIMRRRVQRYPTGSLWRSTREPGKPLTEQALEACFRRLAVKLTIPGLIPYAYRHTYITRWLEAGRSIDDLAALVASSAATIRRFYAHLVDNVDRLRQLADGFTRGSGAATPRLFPAAGEQAV